MFRFSCFVLDAHLFVGESSEGSTDDQQLIYTVYVPVGLAILFIYIGAISVTLYCRRRHLKSSPREESRPLQQLELYDKIISQESVQLLHEIAQGNM